MQGAFRGEYVTDCDPRTGSGMQWKARQGEGSVGSDNEGRVLAEGGLARRRPGWRVCTPSVGNRRPLEEGLRAFPRPLGRRHQPGRRVSQRSLGCSKGFTCLQPREAPAEGASGPTKLSFSPRQPPPPSLCPLAPSFTTGTHL